jgi:hypothetical protein
MVRVWHEDSPRREQLQDSDGGCGIHRRWERVWNHVESVCVQTEDLVASKTKDGGL